MIYILAGTQVLTIIGVLVCVRWVLAYLADKDQTIERLVQVHREEFFKLLVESQNQLKGAREEAFKEREYLLTRIQHPEQAIAQAPSVGVPTSVSFMDEQEEYLREHPEEADEVIRPLQPVKPARAFRHDESEVQ